MGQQRQEEHFDWTWVAEEPPVDLELAWLEWLRAAEAAWCRIHDLFGAQRRPFLVRSKGLVIEHVSLGQATRNDTRRRCSKKGRGLARPATLGGAGGWQPGRQEEGADLAVHATTASQHACFNFVARPWPLGSRLGCFVEHQPICAPPALVVMNVANNAATFRSASRRCQSSWASEVQMARSALCGQIFTSVATQRSVLSRGQSGLDPKQLFSQKPRSSSDGDTNSRGCAARIG